MYTGAIYGKYSLVSMITFSFRPDEAIFHLAWQKIDYNSKTISFEAIKELHIKSMFRIS